MTEQAEAAMLDQNSMFQSQLAWERRAYDAEASALALREALSEAQRHRRCPGALWCSVPKGPAWLGPGRELKECLWHKNGRVLQDTAAAAEAVRKRILLEGARELVRLLEGESNG